MFFIAAIAAGLSLGTLTPTRSPYGRSGRIRMGAVLVLVCTAAVAWAFTPDLSPWPAIVFGIATVAGAIAMRYIDRDPVTLHDAEASTSAASSN